MQDQHRPLPSRLAYGSLRRWAWWGGPHYRPERRRRPQLVSSGGEGAPEEGDLNVPVHRERRAAEPLSQVWVAQVDRKCQAR
jgi:hypothetical protein